VTPSARKYRTFLFTIARYFLAVVFIASAIGKAINPHDFYSFVSSLPFPSLLSTSYFLAVIVTAEVILAILLIVKRAVYWGAILSSCALLAFLVVLIFASNNAATTPCGCFGGLATDHSIETSILTDVILLLLTAMIIHLFGQSAE